MRCEKTNSLRLWRGPQETGRRPASCRRRSPPPGGFQPSGRLVAQAAAKAGRKAQRSAGRQAAASTPRTSWLAGRSLAFQAPNGKPPRKGQGPPGGYGSRLVLVARLILGVDAYGSGTRPRAAMGQQWHSARPVLRVYEVSTSGSTTAAERLWRTIEIHGGVNNWYIDVVDPPKSYRLDIGYLSDAGKYFVLCRSNIVSTPVPGTSRYDRRQLGGRCRGVRESLRTRRRVLP